MKTIVEFAGLKTEIDRDKIKEDGFDVDFNGKMMVRFEYRGAGYVPVDAMNHGGENCFSEIQNEKVKFSHISFSNE